MISVCSVLMGAPDCYLERFFLEQLEKLSEVSEIILAYPYLYDLDRVDKYKKKIVRRIGFKFPPMPSCNYAHAFGLHACLDKVEREYVLFSDPDIYLFRDVTNVYLENMDSYNLDIIGVAHYKPQNLAQYNFPCVINTMIKTEDLPNPSWLENELKVRKHCLTGLLDRSDWDGEPIPGKWLAPSPPPKYYKKFPNANSGCFDTGSNLWLWNEQRKGRFISYWERNGSECLYAEDHFDSNVGQQNFNGQDWLMFHKTHRFTFDEFFAIIRKGKWNDFRLSDFKPT